MKNFLKSIPIPMCGLILAILSLGNLLFLYQANILGTIFGMIGCILMVLILAKIIFVFEHVKHDMKNPIVASTAPTFTMGVMVLCTYLMKWLPDIPLIKYVWLVTVVLHVCLMVYFTYYFLIVPEVTIENIYPSWFVVYCGCGVVPITAAKFFPIIGQVIFWIALTFYFVLLPIVIYRVFIHRKFEDHTVPIITITAAPGSLCLTGYLSGFSNPNFHLVTLLLIISQALYLIILWCLPKLLNRQFYPSYAAFTFPLVICATGISKANLYFSELGYHNIFFKYFAIFETVLSLVVVFYVLVKYVHFIIKANVEHKVPQTLANKELDC